MHRSFNVKSSRKQAFYLRELPLARTVSARSVLAQARDEGSAFICGT